jgi:hypothetical protein
MAQRVIHRAWLIELAMNAIVEERIAVLQTARGDTVINYVSSDTLSAFHPKLSYACCSRRRSAAGGCTREAGRRVGNRARRE